MIQENKKIIKEFTDLLAWQESHKLVLMIYQIIKIFPKEEIFALSDQMKRSAISITSNIAEGFGRQGYKEKIQFYYLAHGSLTELKNQLIISRDINYLNKEKFSKTEEQIILAQKLLQGLISKSKYFLSSKS